jgi:hypothetical protein
MYVKIEVLSIEKKVFLSNVSTRSLNLFAILQINCNFVSRNKNGIINLALGLSDLAIFLLTKFRKDNGCTKN